MAKKRRAKNTGAEKARAAVGYCRVSTGRQAKDGVSLAAQEAAIRAYCEAQGLDLLGTHRDAKSGKDTNRPALKKAIDQVCESGAVLVFYSLSRLARSVLDTHRIVEQVEECGGTIASATESGINTTDKMGRAFMGILSVLAELEREQIAERTQTAIDHLRKTGRRYSGKITYGWRVQDEKTGKLEKDPGEQKTIAQMVQLRGRGLSYRAIGKALVEDGRRPRSGKEWSPKVIGDILDRAGTD